MFSIHEFDFAKANPKVCFLIDLSTYNSDHTPSITEMSVQGRIVPFTVPENIQQLEIVAKGSDSYTFRATFFDFLSQTSDLRGQIEVKMLRDINGTPVSNV